MPPSSNVGDALKFQQLWEIRRRDNDFDSSSEESKSSSSTQPNLKKHKRVSSFISHENEEAVDTDRFQQKGKCIASTGRKINSGKAKRARARRSGKQKLVNNVRERDFHEDGSSGKDKLVANVREGDSHKDLTRKKNETSAYDRAALDEVKFFMESLIEDLKDTRENLTRRMREEMEKLVADDAASKSEGKKGSDGTENTQMQHRNDSESMRVQLQNNLEDNVEVQHQNNYEETLQVQHHTNFKDSIQVQHQNKFNEIVQVQHQKTFMENIQAQHQKDLKSGMREQNSNHRSLGRSVDINEAVCCHTHYRGPEDQVNYPQITGPMPSRAKEKGKTSLVSSVTPKFQPSPSIPSQNQKKIVLGLRAPNCNSRPLERPAKGKRKVDSNNCSKGLEAIGYLPSTEKAGGERLGLAANRNVSSGSSDQVASSMYLTLPTVLREPCTENSRLETSSCNYVQPRNAGGERDVNSETPPLMIGSSACHVYLPDMQQEERRGSFAQRGSSILGCLTQNSTPTSSIGTGFPVPLLRGMAGSFSNPRQLGLKDVHQENYDILGLRMNGGAITFSGGDYALSEQSVANNFPRHSDYLTDGALAGFHIPNLKEGGLFPK